MVGYKTLRCEENTRVGLKTNEEFIFARSKAAERNSAQVTGLGELVRSCKS